MLKVSMFRTLTVWTTDIRFKPPDRLIPSRSAGGRHHAQHCSHIILNLKRRLAQSILIGFDAVLWPTIFHTSQSEYATLDAVFRRHDVDPQLYLTQLLIHLRQRESANSPLGCPISGSLPRLHPC